MNTTKLIATCLLTCCLCTATHGQTPDWLRQIGTSATDASFGVSADALGSIYVSGYTFGDLAEPNLNPEFADAFLGKYHADGTLEWIRHLGTSESDSAWDVSADGLGNVYITGSTTGSLEEANAGDRDAFLSKYDASGNLQWTRQFGTPAMDRSDAVSSDKLGNIFLTGRTSGSFSTTNAGGDDVFVRKYDASGTLQWSHQIGTSEADWGTGISADGLGNAYISGRTAGSLEGTSFGNMDAFLGKYDSEGTLEWIRQIGTSTTDSGWSVSADGLGSVYLAGTTSGSLDSVNAGRSDAFLSKYDASGTLQWTRQFGTSRLEDVSGVSADALGNIYVTGYTGGSLGAFNEGSFDLFLAMYDAGGTRRWVRQLGTSELDTARAVSTDGLGNVYISGGTDGSLGEDHAGESDAFIAKFSAASDEPPATVRTWTIEATVVDVIDPDSIFADVRLGDTVRGFLSYDLATPPDSADTNEAIYFHGDFSPFEVAGMVIENPRGGSDLEFVAALDFGGAVSVTNDLPDEVFEEIDTINAVQFVEPPDGFVGELFDVVPVVAVSLASPEALADTSLPESLNLDDWAVATIAFFDAFETNETTIIAEIFSLTLVEEPGIAGDFNGDGTVNAADYSTWRDGLGTLYTLADYEIWRSNFGSSLAGASGVASVPEPPTWVVMWAVVLGVLLSRSGATAGLPSSAFGCSKKNET